MRYYLSGLADRAHARMALDAGISNILIDPFQFWQIGLDLVREFPHVALDSGSYRIWKRGNRQPNSTDVAPIVRVLDQWDGFDFWVMPDAIPLPHVEGGPPDYNWSAVSTRCIWEIAATEHDRRHRELPVWHWGESDYYLNKYWLETRKLGIGGMVSIFRGGHRQQDKKKKALLDVARTEVVRRLDALLRAKLQAYGAADHLHLFAANHIPSAVQLAPLFTSMDSSKWLDAARYGYLFFRHDDTGELRYRPAQGAGGRMTRDELLRTGLVVWRAWIEEMEAVPQLTRGDLQAAKEEA